MSQEERVTDLSNTQKEEKKRMDGASSAKPSAQRSSALVVNTRPPPLPYKILGLDGNLLIQAVLVLMVIFMLVILGMTVGITNALEEKLALIQRAHRLH